MAVAALQAAFEQGEQGDWDAYVRRRPTDHRSVDVRPLLATLTARIPGLELRAAVLSIDAQTAELAAEAERVEERGDDPRDTLVELFARKERLAREAGHAGYAQLAMAADGLTPEAVEAEHELAAESVGDEDDEEPLGAAEVLDWFRTFFAPLLDCVEVHLEPDALVAGMDKTLHWPDHIGVVVHDRESGRTMAHELGHALQCRARAERGLGFLDWFSLSCVDAETAANLGERLLFARPRFDSEQLARGRFDIAMYAAALDDPAWLDTREGWSREGWGFYTEDPMRRYAYALAYVRSARLYASLPRPLTAGAVVDLL